MHYKRSGILLVLIGFLVWLDQITKAWVLSEPVFRARECLNAPMFCGGIEVSRFGDFVMVWNRGMSFGLFQSDGLMRWILAGLVLGITVGFIIWMARAQTRILACALALVIAGAIGNLIDRVRFGAVVDFLSLNDLYFPFVFNVADVWVNIGAALLFLEFFVLSSRRQVDLGEKNGKN